MTNFLDEGGGFMSFVGRTCIVTGATSGIGLAIAREFAVRHANLVLVGRNVSNGNEIVASLREAGTNAIFVAANLVDRSAPEAICGDALSRFGRIDILINNAGFNIRGTVLKCTDDDWDRVLDVNLSAAFRMSRAVLPTMLTQHYGSIVNVASDWALMGAKGVVAYCVSKAALAQLTRCTALEHAADGIRVNAVCPAETDTPMLGRGLSGADRKARLQTLAAAIPIGRIAHADEVAKVVAFLASDDASFMTGSLVPIDGGTSAQ
jgi:NAD(P)-dependent dehydrogenase (short-subunit alcohol dehydrogenase family)